MAFSGNYMCTSFKVELMKAVHNFTTGTGDEFKLALYDNSASFTAATTAYTATNEVSASGSYSAGGGALTNVTPTSSGTTAFTDVTVVPMDRPGVIEHQTVVVVNGVLLGWQVLGMFGLGLFVVVGQ